MFWLNEEIYSIKVCLVVFVWKLDIFSFHLLYRTLCKSKKVKRYYQLKLTRSRYSRCSRFQKRHWIHARLCFIFCAITLEHVVVTTQPRPFWKEEWWRFSTPSFSLRVSVTRQVLARLKTSFSWIVKKFGKFF